MTPEELVRRHLDGVYGLALRLTGNAADAWDLAQEAMLKAVRALPGFRGDASPSTWLYRITVNAWKNKTQSALSKWWRTVASLDGAPDEASMDPPGREPGPDLELERREEREAVERALGALAPEDRAALVLREMEGKSYEEIAAILGVRLGTVKSRLYRARSTLARELEKTDGA
jgi:RNA polymerase sigma-70 factor, ECF subfamily